MQTKPVANVNLKWTNQMSWLIVLTLLFGCSPTRSSQTTYSSTSLEKISENQRDQARQCHETCRIFIDSLKAKESKKNIDYALFLDKADSFSNKIELLLVPLYEDSRLKDPDEFPQTLVENIYDSLRVFENFTRQSLCPTESPEIFFDLDSTKLDEMLSSGGLLRILLLGKMQRTVYDMLATNLDCKLNN